MEQHPLINLAYGVAGILFILGLKGLTHPRTAVRGNLLGAIAMLIAVVATLCNQGVLGYKTIALGVLVGAVVGAAPPQAANRTASTTADHRGKWVTLQSWRISMTRLRRMGVGA